MSNGPGRPPLDRPGELRRLTLTCTDEEWVVLLDKLPQDTRERYEFIAHRQEIEMNTATIDWTATVEWMQQHPDADPGGHEGADLFDAPLPIDADDGAAWEHVTLAGPEEYLWEIGNTGFGLRPDTAEVFEYDDEYNIWRCVA